MSEPGRDHDGLDRPDAARRDGEAESTPEQDGANQLMSELQEAQDLLDARGPAGAPSDVTGRSQMVRPESSDGNGPEEAVASTDPAREDRSIERRPVQEIEAGQRREGSASPEALFAPAADEPSSASHSGPDLTRLADLVRGPLGIRSLSVTGLFVLAVCYTLFFARDFLLPVVLAILLKLLFGPAVRGMRRVGLPEPVGALFVLAAIAATLGIGVAVLAGPAQDRVKELPQIAVRLRAKLEKLEGPMSSLTRAAKQIEELTRFATDEGPEQATQEVKLQRPGLTSRVVSQTQTIVLGGLEMFILLYFLLASGDLFLRKLMRVLPRPSDKVRAVQIALQIERHISKYLFTITVIYAIFAALEGTALMILGVSHPLLWGVLIFFLSFIPLVGSAAGLIVVVVVALLELDGLGRVALVGIVIFGLNLIRGNIVMPIALGRSLTLNPVVIFLGIAFWGWLWGIPGVFLAVPILAVFRILCEHIEPLRAIGEFLGD